LFISALDRAEGWKHGLEVIGFTASGLFPWRQNSPQAANVLLSRCCSHCKTISILTISTEDAQSHRRSQRCCSAALAYLPSLNRGILFNMPAIIGQKAPAFKGQAIVDGMIKEISLDDFKGKYTVLFFYPLVSSRPSSPTVFGSCLIGRIGLHCLGSGVYLS
jgi:hypothetical protein